MTREPLAVKDVDRDAVFEAQCKLWQSYNKHDRKGAKKSWRAVALKRGVNVKYVYDLVMYNDVPSNKDIRAKLFLPRALPSEKPLKRLIPKIGAEGWEEVYFKRLKR